MTDELLEKIERIRKFATTHIHDVPGGHSYVDAKWSEVCDVLEALVRRTSRPTNTEWATSEARYAAEPAMRDMAHCKLTLETTRPISFAEQAVRMCELNRPVTIVFGATLEKPNSESDEAHRLIIDIMENHDGSVHAGFQAFERLNTYYNKHKDGP